MQRFDSISEGLRVMQQLVATNRRKVGAFLTFQDTQKKQCRTCFLFESVEDDRSQLIARYPDSLQIKGEAKADMPHLLGAREAAMSAVLAGVGGDCLGLQQWGHAEEFLIRGFKDACAQVGDIKNVTIYLSHSPCTVDDQKPSASLPGWPVSCTSKLQRLAAMHPQYFFSICFWQTFGKLQGHANPEKHLHQLTGKQRNLAFIDLT